MIFVLIFVDVLEECFVVKGLLDFYWEFRMIVNELECFEGVDMVFDFMFLE